MVGSREWRRKDKIISWEAEDSRGGTRVHGGVRWQAKLSDFSASLRTSESKRFPTQNGAGSRFAQRFSLFPNTKWGWIALCSAVFLGSYFRWYGGRMDIQVPSCRVCHVAHAP
jgi:hypothetical protein